ncbi:uncharacterized protein CHSO_1120 [Chryseobacterium sp. StRB126]|nr:uncharacterized protein CHSO_1120 [Chryseobacterium sp. StRB126]
MNKKLSNIYVVIFEEKVIAIETNLQKFYDSFPAELKSKKAYDYFYREFKKSSYFKFKLDNRYSLQKIPLNQEVLTK